MKRIHLLRVETPAEAFGELFATAAAAREWLGWLDLEAPTEPPPELAAAAGAGARPAAAVAGGSALTLRRLHGEPVLRDLLRRDFLGCRAVLVRGGLEAPLLEPAAGAWRVTPPGSVARSFSSEQLLAALRRPRPWS
jgi:hypothetical protein